MLKKIIIFIVVILLIIFAVLYAREKRRADQAVEYIQTSLEQGLDSAEKSLDETLNSIKEFDLDSSQLNFE